MAFVSETSVSFPGDGRSGSFAVPVNAGDVLVALVWAREIFVPAGTALNNTLVSVPSGWNKLQESALPGKIYFGGSAGNPVFVPVWTRATTTGTASGTFTWEVDSVARQTAGARIMRFSGMKGVAGWADESAANDAVVYPAVDSTMTAPSGHAVRVAITSYSGGISAAGLTPAGHTLRVDQTTFSSARLVASEESLSEVKPAQVAASSSSQVFARAVTLYVASDVGPEPPTITSPSPLVGDFSQPWQLEWDPVGAQTGARVTRQSLNESGVPTGSVQYLTSMTSPAWTSTPTTLTSSVSQVDFPAGAFAAGGARYRVGVSTVGGAVAPDLGAPAFVDIASFEAPTATDVTSGNIVGSEVLIRTPWLVVAGTPGAGATLDRMQVQVVDHATGAVLVDGTHHPGWWYEVRPEEALPNGSMVRLRGRVRQRAVQWSDWIEVGPYTVAMLRRPAPTVTVAPTVHPTSGIPGVAVTVTSDAGQVEIYRDGRPLDTWPTTGTLTVADYDAPGGIPSEWTAVILATENRDDSLPSPPATYTVDVTGEHGHCWLSDPRHPERALQVHAVDVTEGIAHPTAVYHALQDVAPVAAIVQSLPRHATHGTLTLDIETPAQLETVTSMLTAGRPLTYRRWVETDQSGVRRALPALRFHPVGDVTIDRPAPGPWSWRHVSVAWVSVE